MNKYGQIIIITLIAFVVTSFSIANAEITLKESNDADYLINHGYSPEITRLIDLQHKQINGVDTTEKTSGWMLPVKWYKKIQGYIDPAYDDGQFGTKKIKAAPSVEDL